MFINKALKYLIHAKIIEKEDSRNICTALCK